MQTWVSSVLTAAMLCVGATSGLAQSTDVVLVVNAANPAADAPRDVIAALFLKTTRKWAHGVAAIPVGNSSSPKLSEAFAKRVLNRSAAALESYWQQQIFGGGEVPPPEKSDDAEVLAFVRSTPGAIGYVSASADLGAGVKALKIR